MQAFKNTEIVENKVNVEDAVSRFRRQLDSTTVTVEVFGVYGMPEPWKAKIVSLIDNDGCKRRSHLSSSTTMKYP